MCSVLITGGSSRLGACLAEQYLAAGDRVTVADIEAPQGHAAYVRFDCANPELTWIAEAEPFDIVICNAGISNSDDSLATDSVLDAHLLNVNALRHMALVRELLKHETVRRGGRLVFIISATRYLPFPIAISYAASKGALDAFAQALEAYVVGRGISVTRVYPGPMRTPHVGKYYDRFDDGKGIRPELVARRVIRAVRKRKRQLVPDAAARIFQMGSIICPSLLARLTYQRFFGSGRKVTAARVGVPRA